MTDKAIEISITIKIAECEKKFKESVRPEIIEETLQRMAIAVGQESLAMSIQEIDKQVPKDWQNVGTEERWLVSSLGEMRNKRRICLNEKQNE
jgi:hypothetical protein